MLSKLPEMAGVYPPFRSGVTEVTLGIPPVFMAEGNLRPTLTKTKNIIFPVFVALDFVPAFPRYGGGELGIISIPVDGTETLGHLAFILGVPASAGTPPELTIAHFPLQATRLRVALDAIQLLRFKRPSLYPYYTKGQKVCQGVLGWRWRGISPIDADRRGYLQFIYIPHEADVKRRHRVIYAIYAVIIVVININNDGDVDNQ